jgi:hypothetical protein
MKGRHPMVADIPAASTLARTSTAMPAIRLRM